MYSFTLEMEDFQLVPLIQYVVGLAVTEAVKSVCDKKVIYITFLDVLVILKVIIDLWVLLISGVALHWR